MSYSGWKPLAYVKAAGGEGQIFTPVFEAMTYLKIIARVAGSAVAGIPEIRFNFDASTVNYASRVSNNFAAPTATVAGTATGIRLSQTSSANARGIFVMDVQNYLNKTHGLTWVGSDLSEAAATAPDIVVGAGLFASVGQIQWAILAFPATTMSANSDLAVFGSDVGAY